MFNDLFEMGLILLGIAVNALPTIVEVIQNAVNTVFNFLEPIRSGFNLLNHILWEMLNHIKPL